MSLRKVLSEESLDSGGARLRVLECGIGTGALSSALSDVLPVSFSLAAIEISSRTLEQARRRFIDTNIDVTLHRGDVRNLPYSARVFNRAMTSPVFEHLVDPIEALNEMTRIPKPGGLLVACITRRSAPGLLAKLKWRTHRVTPALAESWLRECGLENVNGLALGSSGFSKNLSVACVGRKALSTSTKCLSADAA